MNDRPTAWQSFYNLKIMGSYSTIGDRLLKRIIVLPSILLVLSGCQSPSTSREEKSANPPSDSTPRYQSTTLTRPNTFTSGIEGPAVDQQGLLYVVNYDTAGTIGVVNAEGEASLFVTLPEGSIGNGIRFDRPGTMYIADYKQHNVLSVDMNTRQIRVFAHQPKMNQPNDLAITRTGILFASDPNWSDSTGMLWRIMPDGTIALLEENMGTTNGVEVSPEEDKLYVNESVQRKVWVYDLSPEGSISNKRLLLQFDDFGMDGMRCDAEGNLYITRHGKGTVAVVSPAGEVVREISLTGKLPSNIAFGGDDGRTAYVTLQDRGCIETFQVEQPGREWAIRP